MHRHRSIASRDYPRVSSVDGPTEADRGVISRYEICACGAMRMSDVVSAKVKTGKWEVRP